MLVDFPIERLEFNFDTFGTANIDLLINNKKFANVKNIKFDKTFLKEKNTIKILFKKSDPVDVESYAILNQFLINEGDFTNEFKKIPYYVDKIKHPSIVTPYPNNLYFGCVGNLTFNLDTEITLLKKAAWSIADNCFETTKGNIRGNPFREKNFLNVYNDYKFMYSGCTPPQNKEILKFLNPISLKEINNHINFNTVRHDLEQWINDSKRIKIKNFKSMLSFNYGSGTLGFLESFISRSSKKVYTAQKHFYYISEVAKGFDCEILNLFEELQSKSFVLFEFPSPWYSNETMMKKIIEAKQKNCYIGIDLTWLPVANDYINLDLNLFDEVFFSMNKTWPINTIRPAWRWSKKQILDSSDYEHQWGYYQTLQPNLFIKLMKNFCFDYVFEYYKEHSEHLRNIFELTNTEILWFTRHNDIKHSQQNYISENYYYDELVCINKLLESKGKFFW